MPSPSDVLVSVCLPVRNGGSRLPTVVDSVLAQDHANFELVISDNASTDDTEEVARALAAADDRIVYVRQPENVGLLNNFISAMHRARGQFFRWVSYDDWIAPSCLSRCLREFLADERLVLVTMGVDFLHNDGTVNTADYTSRALASDPAGALRGDAAAAQRQLPAHRSALRPDAAGTGAADIPPQHAAGGPDLRHQARAGRARGHVREVLARRNRKCEPLSIVARQLDVPLWQAHFANTLQCREMLRWLDECNLDQQQRGRARLAVARMYMRRQQIVVVRRGRKLVRIAREFAIPYVAAEGIRGAFTNVRVEARPSARAAGRVGRVGTPMRALVTEAPGSLGAVCVARCWRVGTRSCASTDRAAHRRAGSAGPAAVRSARL